MAHQTANIPWNVLASNLRWTITKAHPHNGDLHLRFKPNQGKQLNYFVEAFVRNIRNHSATSRKKYPQQYDPPDPEEIILDDATVRKITPTVHRWLSHRAWRQDTSIYNPPSGAPSCYPSGNGICPHRGEPRDAKPQCQCPVPYEERRAAAFYRRYCQNHCNRFFLDNGKAFYNQEIFKTLLLYGEMDTILRVCAYPDVDLRKWWRVGKCYDMPHDAGWDTICTLTLLPYLALNLIHCFPSTWDAASGRTDQTDYRQMRLYQYMLKHCTLSGTTTEVATHPHRQFFGIQDGQFHDYYPALRGLVGAVSIHKFLNCEVTTEHQPTRSDTPLVRQMLYSKGLPMELVLEVMEMAGYVPRGRLVVPHDPFHEENREEMGKYLRYCWELLVRCDMVASAVGLVIPWTDLVSTAMFKLLDCSPRRWYVVEWDVGGFDSESRYTFV